MPSSALFYLISLTKLQNWYYYEYITPELLIFKTSNNFSMVKWEAHSKIAIHICSLLNQSSETALYTVLVCGCCVLSRFSRVRLCDPMNCSSPGSLSMGFSRQEYWSGLLSPFPGIFPTRWLNTCLVCLLHWQVGSLPTTWETCFCINSLNIKDIIISHSQWLKATIQGVVWSFCF